MILNRKKKYAGHVTAAERSPAWKENPVSGVVERGMIESMNKTISNGPIENLTGALKVFLETVGGRFVRAEAGSKGPMCFVMADASDSRAYLLFKRDWLHAYGSLFPNEEWKGWGQTLNYALLKKAASEEAIIVIVMPDGTLYSCDAITWLSYSEKHETIRKPSEEIGLEASIPAKMVSRVTVG